MIAYADQTLTNEIFLSSPRKFVRSRQEILCQERVDDESGENTEEGIRFGPTRLDSALTSKRRSLQSNETLRKRHERLCRSPKRNPRPKLNRRENRSSTTGSARLTVPLIDDRQFEEKNQRGKIIVEIISTVLTPAIPERMRGREKILPSLPCEFTVVQS